MSQQLAPVVASIGGAAADVKQKLMDLDTFFRQHPQYQSAAALRHLVEANKQLKQELFVKQQSLNHALNSLREHSHTPVDRRFTALQQEVQMLKEQLHARDAALAASEGDNRRLRDQLGMPRASSCDSDLSACKGEGQLYGSPGSMASPNVSRRLWAGSDEAVNSSTCSIASSRSNSSRSFAAAAAAAAAASQQQQEQPPDVSQLVSTYQAALAAKDQEVQQLLQQVEELQQQAQQAKLEGILEPQRAISPPIRQLSRVSKPRTMDDALQQLASLNDIISRLQLQMQEQDQQASSRAAERETAFKRQMDVEKRQHEYTRQNCKLLAEQMEQLQERLAKAQAQEMQLHGRLERTQEELQDARSEAAAGPCSSRSTASQVEHMQRLQQHVQDQKEVIQQLQGCVQGVLNSIRAAGRLAGPAAAAQLKGQGLSSHMAQLEYSVQQLLADVASQAQLQQRQQPQEQRKGQDDLQQQVAALQDANEQLQDEIERVESANAACKAEVKKAQQHLLDCEQRLLELQDLKARNQRLEQDNRQLRQSLGDNRSQLDKALEGQHASVDHVEQCRQQLAVAAAERALLMDRIRELADRASLAEAGGCSSGRASPVAAEVQQRLSQACAELNQQVSGLRKQLTESQMKEERLQVVNAQLQERISALQMTRPADLWQAEQQRQEQQHLQQQVQQQTQQIHSLQQQLEQGQHSIEELQQQLDLKQQQVDQQQHQHQELQQTQQELEQQQHHAQELQQQLDQEQQQLAAVQQQLSEAQQHLAAGAGEFDAEVQQLRGELEDRTRELMEWQIHADALEKDLADLKERADAADSMQEHMDAQAQELALRTSQQQALQQQLEQCKNRVVHLEFDLHDAAKDHSALLTRFEAVSAELARVKEGAADMRLRLEHFTGPAGPQARIRQLEASLQSMQRKYEAADARASSAAAEISELSTKLGNAEDEIMALEGQISILEQELARYTQ